MAFPRHLFIARTLPFDRMLQKMILYSYGVLLSLVLLIFMGPLSSDCKLTKKKGDFLAGTFILTQKSLSEAPYRYAGVLRKALDNAETKDPPSKSDEKNCDVRYRIRPSGNSYKHVTWCSPFKE